MALNQGKREKRAPTNKYTLFVCHWMCVSVDVCALLYAIAFYATYAECKPTGSWHFAHLRKHSSTSTALYKFVVIAKYESGRKIPNDEKQHILPTALFKRKSKKSLHYFCRRTIFRRTLINQWNQRTNRSLIASKSSFPKLKNDDNGRFKFFLLRPYFD